MRGKAAKKEKQEKKKRGELLLRGFAGEGIGLKGAASTAGTCLYLLEARRAKGSHCPPEQRSEGDKRRRRRRINKIWGGGGGGGGRGS